MSRELHLVSHSHWDREWHHTFQQFRLRLVQLIDRVLELLDADPALTYFMLDGQTIVLDDYLEIRPDRRAELAQRIGEGRLLIGPWYVHPDEFLVSGEAIVRNLLQGARHCHEWGGRMAVGYVPDQFGHIAQLPQIWQGFGIDTAVLWRGVDKHETGTACLWEGLDGSTVLTAVLADGYNHAEHLPQQGPALAERLRALAASLERDAPSGQPLLIMHGGDHAIIQRQLPTALLAAQQALAGDYTLIESTLPRFMAALRAFGTPAQRLQGELRNSRHVFLLPGVASSRLWIKQRNAAVQTTLERQAEPLAAFCTLNGNPSAAAELRQGWRYLLQNHPHDSICGCSIDQVHHEMITRFDWAEQIAVTVRDKSLATLATQVHTAIQGAEDPRALAIVVFNGAPSPQRGTVSLTLRLAGEATSYEVIDQQGDPVPHRWHGESGEPPTTVEMPLADLPDRQTVLEQIEGNRVMGMGFQEIAMRTVGETLHLDLTVGDQALLSRQEIEQAVLDAENLVTEAHCTRVSAVIARSIELQLTMLAPEIAACGYTTLLLRPRTTSHTHTALEPEPQEAARPIIENERYRVEADPQNGALTITDLKSGLTVGPAHIFLDEGEAGDLYTHYEPSIDTLVAPDPLPRIERETDSLSQSLHIHHTIQLPRALAASRIERDGALVSMLITTRVSLWPGDSLVRFTIDLENRAADHRLRVYTTVPFPVNHAHAACAFGMVQRAAQPAENGESAEKPVGTAPHQGLVAIHGHQGSLILAARGLPEYEILPGEAGAGRIALTLLRSTGWLSRGDLPVRPADAGPPLPTPEAQCLGPARFEYALACGDRPWRSLLPDARAYLVDLCCASAPCSEGALPPAAALIEVQPSSLVLSTFKPAEDGRGQILRVYNDEAVAQSARITLLLPVTRVTRTTLAEHDEEELCDAAGTSEIACTVAPHTILTLRLE